MATDPLMTTYARLPVCFTHGKGAWLWDDANNKYLDAFAGIAVCNLGHAHPDISKALCEQAEKLVHCSNWYEIQNQKELAYELTRIAGMDKVFFCNSGAEANEAAIKMARLHGHQNGIDEPTIIVTEHSFHGRTMATLTATGNRKVQAGFEPLVSGFVRVPYNDIEAIETVAKNNSNIVAILVEPVTGEGGIHVPDQDYLQQLRSLCDRNRWLLMLDEIQTGMGRTGKWFAYQHENIKPDIMTVAKALANGIPIGACMALEPTALLFKPGNHGSTFGGNPLACKAALATIRAIESNNYVARAKHLGNKMLEMFKLELKSCPAVREIRGKGLMIGIELNVPCKQLIHLALDQKLLINVTADNVVRLLPPLIISDTEAHDIVKKVSQLIINFAS